MLAGVSHSWTLHPSRRRRRPWRPPLAHIYMGGASLWSGRIRCSLCALHTEVFSMLYIVKGFSSMQIIGVQDQDILAADRHSAYFTVIMQSLPYRMPGSTSCGQRQPRSFMTISGMRQPRLQTVSVARSNASSQRTRQNPSSRRRSGKSASLLQADTERGRYPAVNAACCNVAIRLAESASDAFQDDIPAVLVRLCAACISMVAIDGADWHSACVANECFACGTLAMHLRC